MDKLTPQERLERRRLFNKPWVECSRPLCFRTERPPYDYGVGGSCFIIRYKTKLWAVTAKHAIGIVKPSQIVIPYYLGSTHLLPIADAFGHEDYKTDSECTDFAVFEIDMEKLDTAHFKESTVYDLDSEVITNASDGALVAIHGFPTHNNKSSADGALIFQRDSIKGLLRLKSPMTGCAKVELLSDAGLESHDGFSGAPIFVASEEFGETTLPKLLGVNTRGSAKARVKTFIVTVAIKSLIDYHIIKKSPTIK